MYPPEEHVVGSVRVDVDNMITINDSSWMQNPLASENTRLVDGARMFLERPSMCPYAFTRKDDIRTSSRRTTSQNCFRLLQSMLSTLMTPAPRRKPQELLCT